MEPPRSSAYLSQVPFADQCALIDERVRRDEDIPELLDSLGRLRDHEPLAHAVATLAAAAMLTRADIAQQLERAFTTIPDTGIQRVLAVADHTTIPAEQARVLVECAVAALRVLPFERLAVVCLIDRWLKNHAPDVREREISRVSRSVREHLSLGRIDELRDEQLLLIPGAILDTIDIIDTALTHGERDRLDDIRTRFHQRLGAFADRVLDILERAPKSLSQANAEDILARRVYTDPGHFLFELLQNAEDAGARSFRLTFEADALTVWHDGVAFDAKDVVGVLSIGQTTKRRDQIGFFGVGFKSVYEVCVRPQVYSGPFSFEIADVSIPRRIARPADHVSGTRLVLRLRDPDDATRGVEALFARALAIPAQTLLTLSSLQHIEIRSGERHRIMSAHAPDDAAEHVAGIHHVRLTVAEQLAADTDPDRDTRADSDRISARTITRRYLVAAESFACDPQLVRDSERVSETRVLIGIELDAAGAPVPLADDAPTIFSFLPTRERSGLRFLLHAHFDLPVDRERLDLDGAWNRWAIGRAGVLLARVAAACSTRDTDGPGHLLDILPLDRELTHVAYRGIAKNLAMEVGDTPFVPGADGMNLPLARAFVADDRALVHLLTGVDITASGGRLMAQPAPTGSRGSSPSPGRRERVALALGAQRFTADDLIALLERTLEHTRESDVLPASWCSRHHGRALLDALSRMPSSADRDARLSRLPLLQDRHGRARRGASVVRADRHLREVYGDARVFLHPDIDDLVIGVDDSTEARAALLRRLGVAILTADDLLADLRDPARSPGLVRRDNTTALFDYLARLPGEMTANLGALPVFLTDETPAATAGEMPVTTADDRLRRLVGEVAGPDAIAWLRPGGPFGEFIVDMRGKRPPLVEHDIDARHHRMLRRLGGRVLDLAALLTLMRDHPGALVFDRDARPGDVIRFHRTVDAMRSDISPRVARALLRAPVFPDQAGQLRPLIGPDQALVSTSPDDTELERLAPAAPWLDSAVARLSYVRTLGHSTIGARELALALADGSATLVVNIDDDDQLRRAYRYLMAHAREISADVVNRLAHAHIWMTESGQRCPLEHARLPGATDDLDRLYRGWKRFPVLEARTDVQTEAGTDASPDVVCAGSLAHALGLGHRLITPDHRTLVQDLVIASYEHESGLQPLFGEPWPVLLRCLHAAARELPRARLQELAMACIFRADDQRAPHRHALIDWREPADRPGVARAHAPLREVLAAGTRPLVSRDDEAELGVVLDAMDVSPARLGDLVRAMERDPALATTDARNRARAALVLLVEGHGPEVIRDRLSGAERASLLALPLWPTTDGRMLPASEVVRSRALGDVLGPDGADGTDDASDADGAEHEHPELTRLVGASMAILASHADSDARRVSGLVDFRDPLATLAASIADIARVGLPLSEQPALLRTPERVARLFAALHTRRDDPAPRSGTTARTNAENSSGMAAEDIWALPLVVDAAGTLVRGRRHRANPQVLAFARHLPLFADLAHPVWADAVEARCSGLLLRSSVRQVLAALADAGRDPWPVGERSHLGDLEAREALYSWLLEHRDAIAGDSQARGALGRACVIASEQGVIRAPRALLLDPTLPDLGIDWNAAPEVPEPLCAWLRESYAVDDKRLAPLMEHLLSAHERAVRDRSGERSADILAVIARSLRIGEISDDAASALVKRFKLRKRLRVEDTAGAYTRPRALLAPTPEHWRAIVAFAEDAPLRVSSRYDDRAVRRLIQFAGARADLDAEVLARYLQGDQRRPGLDANLALAVYIAERAEHSTELRAELKLSSRAWIPDRSGEMRAPTELYWPESDVQQIIGDHPSRFPHPRLFHAVPESIQAWLPFRQIRDAALSDVVAHVHHLSDRGHATPDAILSWFEQQLRDGRVRADALREALSDRALLSDDRGQLRPVSELLREDSSWYFGQRRGVFSAGNTCTRLASALKIPRRPGKREVLGVLAEILADLDRRESAALLAEEPRLTEHLGRCLAILAAAGGRMPERLPIPVESIAGDVSVCPAPCPGVVFIPSPVSLWHTAVDTGAPILAPLVPAPERESIYRLLIELGVPTLADADVSVLPAAARYRAERERERTTADLGDGDGDGASSDASASTSESRQQRRQRERRERRELARREQLERRAEKAAARAARQAEQAEQADRPPPRPTDDGADDHEPGTEDAKDTEDARETDDGDGLITRLRRWFTPDSDKDSGKDEGKDSASREPEATGSSEPGRSSRRPRGSNRERAYRPPSARGGHGGDGGAGLPDHSQWFRPRHRIGPQMGDNTDWARDRQHQPAYGLAVAPRSLPSPHLYAAQTIMDRFDPGTQRWTRTALPAAWHEPRAAGRFQVRLSGRLPAGEVVLPVPAYARVLKLSSRPEGRLITSRTGASILYAERDSDVEYTVVLDQLPAFDQGGRGNTRDDEASAARARHLLTSTVADDELPAEVHDALDRIQDDHDTPLAQMIAVRDFIRARYYYDPAYIEDPEVGQWLQRISQGRQNAHIAAMHAGRDARYLGRGVCYELNSLACELLRRVGIPAAVATGWTMDRGYVDQPDHMWAVALLPTPQGPRFMPIDASTTRDGQPLHAGRRPPGPWRARAPRQSERTPEAPSWANTRTRQYERSSASDGAIPLSDLMRVMRYLEKITGETADTNPGLRRRCRALLRDPDAARRVLEELRTDVRDE